MQIPKIYIGQFNPTIGALRENADRILDIYRRGAAQGAEIVMVPELAISGYPPRDLLDRKVFVNRSLELRDEIAKATGDAALIYGSLDWNRSGTGKPLHNTAVVGRNGRILFSQVKTLLPTYDVFDELRYFEPATDVEVLELFGRKLGILICEDFWYEEKSGDSLLYRVNPVERVLEKGAEILLNISASPFNLGKKKTRFELFSEISRRYSVPMVYVNQIGGNDELLFDGASMALDENGEAVHCSRSFEEEETMIRFEGAACDPVTAIPEDEEVGEALKLGLRDYLRKTGFRKVVIGLSGGIDSAVTAAIAVEALGSENVTGILMPSEFSSTHSVDDAQRLAGNLGIRSLIVPIAGMYESYSRAFETMFPGHQFNLTDENVQARIRGNLLMAWSNETGAIVVSTGNKSEMAVGYCTLYGDMAGGLALLGDVYKTSVYKVARWLNRNGEVIPESSITKPPSAELRPGQMDQDSLPPYDILDGILKLYIEKWLELDEIVEHGFDRATVERVIRMVDGNEFKRRQAAPTIRVSTKAFGSGRQMPIAQRWRRE
jgi:NAD+ synthase (glutamine-hydrolysing)